MQILIKHFKELSVNELYEILKLRSAVFVVEQQCVYQDVDGKDRNSYHISASEAGQLAAYCRVIPPEDDNCVHIGRVVVREDCRGKRLGIEIMKRALEHCALQFPQNDVVISAQSHLQQYYADLGFIAEGQGYLEDGIPHHQMRIRRGAS